MPLNKRGEFIPSPAQIKKGVEYVTFSQPYKIPYSDSLAVDVYKYSPGDEYSNRKVIQQVSLSVAQAIADNYRKEMRTARSAEAVHERNLNFDTDYYTRESGRTGVLMSNLAENTGLAQVFKLGLQGVLSPKAQKNFDSLTFMVSKISQVPNLSDFFYEEAREEFKIVAKKYELWKANNRAITEKDGFTEKDLRELEHALDKLTKIATEYYKTAIKANPHKGMGVKSTLNTMRSTGDFIEGSNTKRMKTRDNKW